MQGTAREPLYFAAGKAAAPSGLKRSVTIQANTLVKAHGALGDMTLPAVYVSDDKGCLSPVAPASRTARRSADMSAQFKPMKAGEAPSSRAKSDSGETISAWDAKLEAKGLGGVGGVSRREEGLVQGWHDSSDGAEDRPKNSAKSFSGEKVAQHPLSCTSYVMHMHKLETCIFSSIRALRQQHNGQDSCTRATSLSCRHSGLQGCLSCLLAEFVYAACRCRVYQLNMCYVC